MNVIPNMLNPPPIRPHILILEDEVNLAKGLSTVMEEEGYEVDLAETGQAALEKFQREDFDLLVADLRLPDMDGMEVIYQIREKKPRTNVVIITGYPSVSSAVQAVKMGVTDYLRKPFTEDEFKTAIKSALEKKQKESMEKLLEETQKERLIQKEQVIRVLERASEDETFFKDLMENGSVALKEYHLSQKAKAAIISGDLEWIRKNVGELPEEKLLFIYKRLEREAW